MSLKLAGESVAPRKIRLGMVGGGAGAFIGAVHRAAARLDDRFALVAGALSSEPARAFSSALALGIERSRAYAHFQEMAVAEAARADGVEAVAIVTPNSTHFAIAAAFLRAGIHVIVDKPVTVSSEEATELLRIGREAGKRIYVTYNYTGYPMVRHARELVKSNALGRIKVVQVEYLQQWLTMPIEDEGNKQATWRTDPAQAGPGGSIADIGTHAYNLAEFVTGLRGCAVSAELSSSRPSRTLDDNAFVKIQFEDDVRGMLWATQIAPGNENGLRIRIYGDRGGLSWCQEQPNELRYAIFGEATRLITKAGYESGSASAASTRWPSGHPEGYLEAFSILYREIADELLEPSPRESLVPTGLEGFAGLAFVEAAIASSADNGAWTSLRSVSSG